MEIVEHLQLMLEVLFMIALLDGMGDMIDMIETLIGSENM